jgi:PTS system mannose-specific IIA component
MAVGVLLITHEGIGTAVRAVAARLVRPLPMPVEVFEVPFDGDLDTLLPQASVALRRADGGDGVLVLTDLYGATPSNLAARVAHLGTPVHRVSALSLPMLLRVLNYAEQPFEALAAVAAAGARNGVVVDDA